MKSHTQSQNLSKTVSNIEKIVEKRDLYVLSFEQEEAQELGLNDSTHFEASKTPEGYILLKPYKKLDVDLDVFPTSTLRGLVEQSIEENIPVDEILRKALQAICQKRPENKTKKRK